MIALIGLENAGLIVFRGGTRSLGLVGPACVSDPDLHGLRPPGTTPRSVALAAIGIILTAALLVRRARGAILLGMAATALLGIPLGVVDL